MSTTFTVTYSPDVKGWPSFYSYYPEFIKGMNNYLYTFKNGNIYRHNTNEERNSYYDTPGSDPANASKITTVFNVDPLTVKLFKTVELESDAPWKFDGVTDLQTGSIETSYFEEKEGAYFSFIRAESGTENFNMRSANGIGTSTTVTGPANATVISFQVNIGSILSVGDTIFFGTTPTKAGSVTAIDRANKQITVDCSAGTPPPASAFILSLKDSVAESMGMRGYFCEFTLTNNDTTPVELFAVTSDILKSYP